MKANQELLNYFLNAGSSIYIDGIHYCVGLGDIRILKNNRDIFFASGFPEDQHHCHILRDAKDFNLINSRNLEFTAEIYVGRVKVILSKVEREEEESLFDALAEWRRVLNDPKEGAGYRRFLDREYAASNGDFS